MNKQEILHTAATEAAKGAPPASVALIAQANGWTLADVVTVLTVIYLVLQIGWLIWKWWRAAKHPTPAAGDPDHG